jgi:hypothetical protein
LSLPIEVEPNDRLIVGLETTGASCVVVVGGATTGVRVTGVGAGAEGVVTAGAPATTGAGSTGAGTTGVGTTGGVVTTGLGVDGAGPAGTVGAVLEDSVPYWVAVEGAIGMTAGI